MEIAYTSKLFSLRHSSEYKLSIQVSLNGFSFCVYDFKRESFLLLKYFPIDVDNNLEYFIKELEGIIKKEELFSHKFKQVNLIYSTPNSTIIPEELSKKTEGLKDFLGFQHAIDEFDELHQVILSQNNISVLFSIPSAITNLFVNIFGEVNFTNQYTLLLNLAQEILEKENISEFCLINKNEVFFDIIIFKDKKLELCNSFNYITQNDLVYYSISALKNLGLAETDIPVYYSGILREKGQDTQMLNKFIQVFIKNEPYQIKPNYNIELFDKYPPYYFTLLYFVNF